MKGYRTEFISENFIYLYGPKKLATNIENKLLLFFLKHISKRFLKNCPKILMFFLSKNYEKKALLLRV